MKKVRIKTAPGTRGEQDQFALVDNLTPYYGNLGAQSDKVNETFRALKGEDLKKAKIEVEGGESVIGDSNRDGHVDLFHFKGKRHSEGGMPVDIPEGSFIYSDTKKLAIKDRELLQKFFGLPYKKGGYTPAEISKKYSINKYVQILKDENSDAISKRTANEMIKKHTEKLGILAFIQEAMKGFPDGIPEIAMIAMQTIGADMESLMQAAAPPEMMAPQPPMMNPEDVPMEAMMMGSQEEMEEEPEEEMEEPEGMMRFGGRFSNGLPSFQDGGLQEGKIYTFKDRPGSYYKVQNGKVLIKNENTGGKYVPMSDPEGTRRKTLEAGINSGKTVLYNKPSSSSSSVKSVPGFGTTSEFEEFKRSGETQRDAALTYEKALQSNDPQELLRLASYLEKQDVSYSVGWLPWTDQDKLQDMAGILRERAQKLVTSDYVEKTKSFEKEADNYIQKLIVKNRKTIDTLPLGSEQRTKLIEENKKLDALYTKNLPSLVLGRDATKHDRYRRTPEEIKYITSLYDKKFGENIGSKYDMSMHGYDMNLDERSKAYSNNKGLASATSEGTPQGVYKMKPTDEYGKSRQNFEYKIQKDASGKDAWWYVDTRNPGAWQKLGSKESIDRLNRDYGKNIGYVSTAAPVVETPDLSSDVSETPQANTDQRSGTPSPNRGGVRAPQPTVDQQMINTAFDAMNFKYGGAYKSVYQFKYGGKTTNLKQYQLAGDVTTEGEPGQVKGNPDEVFVSDGDLNGTKVKFYRKTVNGKVINIARNAETGTLLLAKDPSTGNITYYDEAKGFSYTYDKNKKLLEKETRPYAGEAWKAEGWKGKYDESSKEFERLLRSNPDLQASIVAEFKRGIQDDAYYGPILRKQRPEDYKRYKEYLNTLTDEQIIDLLIKGNTDNLRFKSVFEGKENALREAKWDVSASGERNAFYRDVASQIGVTPFANEAEIAAYEAAYQAASKIFQNPIHAEKAIKAGFNITPTGVTDQQDAQGRPITPVTGIAGNTFIQETFELAERPKITPEGDTPPPPGMKTAYYCVQGSDGTKNVVSVEYKEGETPVTPTGATSAGYSSMADAEAICAPDENVTPEPKIPADGPWYLPDYTNFLTASNQRIGNFPANLRRLMNLGIGYDTLNPMTRIAALTSSKRQRDELAQQTTDPTTALTLMYGDPQFSQDVAGQIGEIELQNIGITGQAYGQRAELDKTLGMFNVGQQEKYDIASATHGQQSLNSLNKRDALKTLMFNTGWHNWSKRKGLEQVLFPQVRQNPILADWAFSGEGRDFTNPYDTYVNPMTGSALYANPTDVTTRANQVYKDAYEGTVGTMGEEGAKSYAANAAKLYQQQQYAAMNKGRIPSRAQQAIAASPYGMGFGAATPYSVFDDDAI